MRCRLLGVCVDAAAAVERLGRALDDRVATATAVPTGGSARVHDAHLAVARQAAGRTTTTATSTAAGARLPRARGGLADLTGRTQAFLFEALLAGVRVPLEGTSPVRAPYVLDCTTDTPSPSRPVTAAVGGSGPRRGARAAGGG
jgi:hypothetical protein